MGRGDGEQVALTGQRRVSSTLLNTEQPLSAQAEALEVWKKAFVVERFGLRTEIDDYMEHRRLSEHHYELRGKIFDEQSQMVGEFTRWLQQERVFDESAQQTDQKLLRCKLSYLRLDPQQQRKGFGRWFHNYSLQTAKESGVDYVDIWATDVGAGVWMRDPAWRFKLSTSYPWRFSSEPEPLAETAGSLILQARQHPDFYEQAEQLDDPRIEQIASLHKHGFTMHYEELPDWIQQLQRPSQVYQLGQERAVNDMWLGKLVAKSLDPQVGWEGWQPISEQGHLAERCAA